MPFRTAGGGAATALNSGTSFPPNPDEGDVFYRTDLNEFYVYDGTDWVRWEIETHESEHEAGGADEIPSGSLNPQDPTAHETSHESGGADALPLANLPMPGDDTKIQLGAGPDFSIFYDSANDDFRIRDEVNGVETNLPKNVAMNLASHAGRHQDGGADELDAADLSGAGGTAGQIIETDGAALSYREPPRPDWTLVDSYEDSDTGTAFDYNPGAVTSYDVYRILLQIQGQSSATISDVYCRVEADSSSNYHYNSVSGGATSQTTGATEWTLLTTTYARVATLSATLFGTSIVEGAGGDQPEIIVDGATGSNQTTMLNGMLNVNYPTVDQIRVWASTVSTGQLRLYGLNL